MNGIAFRLLGPAAVLSMIAGGPVIAQESKPEATIEKGRYLDELTARRVGPEDIVVSARDSLERRALNVLGGPFSGPKCAR